MMPIERFNTIEEAIEDIKNGKIVIVVDDEDRENEGDFIIAAEKVTPEAVNFMAKYGRGLICVAITELIARELELEPMVDFNTSKHNTAFLVSVDYIRGTTTGISAFDRAKTIQAIVDPKIIERTAEKIIPIKIEPLTPRAKRTDVKIKPAIEIKTSAL